MSDVMLSTEEAAAASELHTKIFDLVTTVGENRLGIRMMQDEISAAERREDEFLREFQVLQEEENKLVADLTTKYGAGSVDLGTGKFIPKQ